MKEYPTIGTTYLRSDTKVFVWDKIDGSNIRAEWNQKRGFYKFGSRTQLIDETSSQLGEAIKLIKEQYSDSLGSVFRKERWKSVVAFFEFSGPGSFAGNHNSNELHEVTLLDVDVDRTGILESRIFYDLFNHVKLPKLLHVGKITHGLVESVRSSTLPGMTFEGVVCKGPIDRKNGLPVMFKIKSNAWLTKLKSFTAGDEALFARLV